MHTVRLTGAAAGLLADRLVGELPTPVHPVALFGRAMAAADRLAWRDSRTAGAAYAGVGIGAGVVAGRTVGRSRLAVTLATEIVVAGAPSPRRRRPSPPHSMMATSTAPDRAYLRLSAATPTTSTKRVSPGPWWSRWPRTPWTP